MKDQQEQHQPRHHNRQENSRQPDNHRSDLSRKLGQFFGLIYNIALVYFVCDLAKSGNQKLALIIFSINAFMIIFVAVLVKRPSKNHNDRRRKSFHPRNNKERNDRNRTRN